MTKAQVTSGPAINTIDGLTAHVLSRIPDLEDVPYTAREICTEEVWCAFSPGEQRRIGENLFILVMAGKIPLVYLGKNDQNHHVYRRL
jgi:hypothetical protein